MQNQGYKVKNRRLMFCMVFAYFDYILFNMRLLINPVVFEHFVLCIKSIIKTGQRP